MSLDTITKGRLLMEKRYFLNNSNSKFISIGIKPATKLLENSGFYVETGIGGDKMKFMSLGGLDGFLNLCKSLRTFEELKFTYPHCAGNYKEMENSYPLNISKKMWGGSVCFSIDNIVGEHCIIAQNSCSEMLKMERLIVAAIKKFTALVVGVEKKFNDTAKTASDFSAIMADAEKSGDLLTIEIITNFNALLTICFEKINVVNTTGVSGNTPIKRKRNSGNAPKKTKKSKDDHHDDHSYSTNGNDGVEIIEMAENSEETENVAANKPDDAPVEPLGLIESGQRFDSELYV